MKNTKMMVLIMMLLALLAACFRFWDICLTFFSAMVMAYLLGPAARFITKKLKVRHGFSVALIIALFVVALVLLVSMSVPYVINQVSALVRDLSAYAGNYDELVGKISGYLSNLGLPQAVLDTVIELAANIDTYLMGLLTAVLQGLVNISAGLFDLVVVVILIIYFMLDGQKLMDALRRQLPTRVRGSLNRVTYTANALTKKYIKTRILISAGMALVTYIGFSIMHIRYALLFAVMSFVLDFIPYFGSIIAGVVEGIYALIVGGPSLAIPVIIFVLVVQQIEGNVVAPKVSGDATGIHPVTVMFALLACNQLFGPVGMLISTPLAAIVKIIFQEAYHFVVTPDGYDPDQLSMDEV